MDQSAANVIVIGGGAAGIIAAWKAACEGAKVLLLEKTPRLGTKILISGGGKCNITHDGPIEDVLKAFRPNEARFIRPACYRFPNTEIVRTLVERGLEVYTRPDGRIFPVNQTAKDVVAILRSILQDAGVTVLYNTPVTAIEIEEGRIQGVVCGDRRFVGTQVIVSVGGSSYPNSGTTGDGWEWARQGGHAIVPIRAALAPMDTDPSIGRFPGVAIRNCILKARQNSKEIARWDGDLLFTHHGISGPCALGISRIVAEHLPNGEVSLEIDIEPNESFESITSLIQTFIAKNPKKMIARFFDERLPASLIEPFFNSSDLDAKTIASQLQRKDRNKLVEALKGWKIGRVLKVPLDKGECVAGGVSLDEVDPQTMKSSKIQGLFFCGEVLDIAGPVGGYNLQAAFATGFVAGESAARAALAER